MVYQTGARRTHSMDLHRIVEEVEERKRYELALVGPVDRTVAPQGAGAAGSLLVAVRDRMLAENPEADVAGIEEALGAPPAPAARAESKQASDRARGPSSDDFLERYLEMSVEFEDRFGVKGWADFVAKKTEAHRGHHKGKPAGAKPKAVAKGRSKSVRRKR